MKLTLLWKIPQKELISIKNIISLKETLMYLTKKNVPFFDLFIKYSDYKI